MHLLLIYKIYGVEDLTYTRLPRRQSNRVRVPQEAAASHWLQQFFHVFFPFYYCAIFLAYNGLRSPHLPLLSPNSSFIADRTEHSVSIPSNVGGRQSLAIEKMFLASPIAHVQWIRPASNVVPSKITPLNYYSMS